ncbi:MAG: glycosyltransferase, partial [Bacteroidales bacterium]|nr:glycosyltransferase [Bacteroidales bacterium]
IQCPTETVKKELERFNFKAELRVISNGTKIKKEPVATSPETDPYLILMTGRYSNEKDPLTLLEAMKYSRHAREIQLDFAGRGLLEPKMRRAGDKLVRQGILKYPPRLGFHSPDELKTLSADAYLYIHCAIVEVEGLSCLEAIRDGAVPVISQAPLSATSQFALVPESLFPAKDPRALAERIDWWIEHPEERQRMSLEYAKSALNYDVQKTIQALIQMYNDALSRQ